MSSVWIVCAIILQVVSQSRTLLECEFEQIGPNEQPQIKACINGDCKHEQLKAMMDLKNADPIIFSKEMKVVKMTVSHRDMKGIRLSMTGAASIKLAGNQVKRPSNLSSRSRWDVRHMFSSSGSVKIIIKGRNIVLLAFTVGKCSEASCVNEPIDVAIIGSGPSGSFSAWQLSKKYPDWKIHLFEASNRIGGRVHSVTIPGMTDFKAELGAMRLHTWHTHALKVVDELGLTIQPFTTVNENETLYYLREKLLDEQDVEAGNVPYALTEEEKLRSGSVPALRSYWNTKLLADGSDGDVWKLKCKDGQFAYEKGIYNAYMQTTSQDAYEYMAYRSIFTDDYFENTNYADFTDIEEFPKSSTTNVDKESSKLYTVKEGMQQIPKLMVEQFLQKSKRNRHVFMNHLLVSLEYIGNIAVLNFKDNSQDKMVEVCARHVITGVSTEALKHINFKDKDLSDAMFPLLPAVKGLPAVKIFLAYDRPWWRTDGQRKAFKQMKKKGIDLKLLGTDMPIGQLLEFGIDNKTGNAMLLVYADWWRNLVFWTDIGVSPDGGKTPDFVIHLVNSMLSKIFNISEDKLPQPYYSFSQAWYKAPIWAAWHLKAPGFNYPEVAKKIQKPIKSKNFYVVGEAFSNSHTWIEGALVTAEEVLEKHFGV